MGTANMISPLVMGLGRSMVVLNATVGAGGPMATTIITVTRIMGRSNSVSAVVDSSTAVNVGVPHRSLT